MNQDELSESLASAKKLINFPTSMVEGLAKLQSDLGQRSLSHTVRAACWDYLRAHGYYPRVMSSPDMTIIMLALCFAVRDYNKASGDRLSPAHFIAEANKEISTR